MQEKTFAEKILGAPEGTIVFRRPDIVLTHDNTASIKKTFEKIGGDRVFDPSQLMVVLDHNSPPTSANLANDYRIIRQFVKKNGIANFYDVGQGICHQLMSRHARPGMLIVGSDSHTCTAGAFNSLAIGLDRTETAGLYMRGETWFLVPQSMKIALRGRLNPGVYAKDLALWIIGKIGADGANYLSVEFHGAGVNSLSISERMTLANMTSEMGAQNAVFPADHVLSIFTGQDIKNGVWADPGAKYKMEVEIDLAEIFPLVAAPHSLENIRSVAEVEGTKIDEAVIGTCTNGRLDDLRVAAEILNRRKVAVAVQLLVIPASREIYLHAVEEGIITGMLKAGAIILPPSCGPCLGTGQGIPADGYNVISTANRNFSGRMGNPKANIFLASPATVAMSAINGVITDPREKKRADTYKTTLVRRASLLIPEGENRKAGRVWDYTDVDNLNTDQMFSGKLTYSIMGSDAAAIMPHLFKGFDASFAENVKEGDIIMAGHNFGCGSSREHPAVGLAYAGVKAVVAKGVNRIFYRAAINQGLLVVIHQEAVESYRPGDDISLEPRAGELRVGGREFYFEPLSSALMDIIEHKGLVQWLKETQ